HVVRAQRTPGADLRSLLTEQGGPQAEFALPLQGDRLGVDAADQREVAVEPGDLVVGDVEWMVRMIDALPFRRQQLDHVRFGLHRVHAQVRYLLRRTPDGVSVPRVLVRLGRRTVLSTSARWAPCPP